VVLGHRLQTGLRQRAGGHGESLTEVPAVC
jgi:hypothetical protein